VVGRYELVWEYLNARQWMTGSKIATHVFAIDGVQFGELYYGGVDEIGMKT
jgi:hypothetical protein